MARQISNTESLMRRFTIVFGAVTALTLLVAGCAGPGVYNGGGYYSGDMNYDPNCDYYTPPWGSPPDYCHYRTWNEPVYYGGIWYSGPTYYRTDRGLNVFWLNGDWRRDEWRGQRPRIDWNRGGNQFWRGEIHRGRDGMPDRNRVNGGRGPRAGGDGNVSPPDGGRGARRSGPNGDGR